MQNTQIPQNQQMGRIRFFFHDFYSRRPFLTQIILFVLPTLIISSLFGAYQRGDASKHKYQPDVAKTAYMKRLGIYGKNNESAVRYPVTKRDIQNMLERAITTERNTSSTGNTGNTGSTGNTSTDGVHGTGATYQYQLKPLEDVVREDFFVKSKANGMKFVKEMLERRL